MYITLKSLKKTLGKYIEYTDLYIALPSIILFLILFMIKGTRIISLIFISLILPVPKTTIAITSNKDLIIIFIWFKTLFIIQSP